MAKPPVDDPLAQHKKLVARVLGDRPAWSRWRAKRAERTINLGGADLRNAYLQGIDLSRAVLSHADLTNADLSFADLTGTDLSGANLTGAILSSAVLRNAKLSHAVLRDADLSEAKLDNAALNEANLNDAKLNNSYALATNFFNCSLRNADLTHADLYHANLGYARLRNANLTNANLSFANLAEASLSGAILANASFSETILGNTDLTNAIGLETCRHSGPSILDFGTLERSGPLPLTFLRGLGLPDSLIDYLPSLRNRAIQYFSCFISYSHRDEEFAQRLHADLQNKGVRCWFAHHDLPIGGQILDEIDAAIRLRDKVLIVLSEQSINSDWVEDEVKTAFEEERKRKQTVLFPIRLDDSIMETKEAWAAKLRADRHIGDFRRWKSHDQYQKTLERVLRDLATGQKPK